MKGNITSERVKSQLGLQQHVSVSNYKYVRVRKFCYANIFVENEQQNASLGFDGVD
jgi:hypothetical protein